MSDTIAFNNECSETTLLTSHATYSNGQLKRYDAFTHSGKRVNIFDGYTQTQTPDGKFNGYQDKKGRKVEVRFGDTIYVGTLNNEGKMSKNRKSFYSVSYYAELLEKRREKTR